jgi:hypothetical protein
MEDEDEDFGSLMFTHGLDGNPAGPGFCNVDKVSEVEELVRGYLIDRVLEKAAGDGPDLVPMAGPNPFKKDDGKGGKKAPPKQIELWQAAALAMELEKPLSPEMIKAAREHADAVLKKSKFSRDETKKVRDELKPGEAVVWVDKPDAATLARSAWFTTIITIVGLLFVGGILAVIYFTMQEVGKEFGKDAPKHDNMFGMVFMGYAVLGSIGLVAALLYPFYKRWQAGKAFYVLTSRRALVWAAEWHGGVKLEAYGPRDLSNVHTIGKDVVFRTVTTIYRSKKGGDHTTTQRFGFLAIEDPVAIEKLVRETLVEPFLEKAYE